MAADDKESDECHQSRSLERDRGKCRHRSASPSSPNQRRNRSRSLGAEEKHMHKNLAENYEDHKGHELNKRNTEGMSEEDNDREVAKKSGVEGDEKAGARKSSKEDRKVELHSNDDSSKDAYSDNESDSGIRKKKGSKNHTSRKSKGKDHWYAHSESEQDESQTEGTSGESSEESEDEYKRANIRKQLKQNKKAECERQEERRRRRKEKMKGNEREHKNRKKKKKKEKVEKRAKGPIIDDVSDGLEGDNMHGESSIKDPILEPKHKIFLSHSGAQKEFVDHLCKALEDRCHYPFFDRRHESLPKGERFPELIVQAIEQCEMLIVVVSNEYFMSKWPMIELNAFVKAHKLSLLHQGSKIGPKILPLFYGLSVSDLDNEGMRKKWFLKWKTLAEVDPKNRIVISDWKSALNVLRSFNGLSYDRNLKEVVAYEDKIVSHVCNSISPDIQWDDIHVQGKSKICKVIGEKFEGIGISCKYHVKVVGIYGVGGIGKTTTCKTLCNELSRKYEGRVCHIEFPSDPSSDSKELFRELYQKVLRDLTRKSMEVIQQLNEGECKDILRKSLFKQKIFLAIDNISDNHQSIEEAKVFLEVPYHMESLVVVMAQSPSVLTHLGLDGDACLAMLDLGEADAVKLFLHHVGGGKQFFEDNEVHDIMTCVKRCYFSKANREGHHYHPLALKSLGLQLSCYGENPCDWVKNLPRVRNFNFFPGRNPVFDILRSSFDLLPSKDQTLFMDVGFFSKTLTCVLFPKLIEGLCCIHKQDEEEITFRLEHLKRKGLLENVDLKLGRISMHDLYVEFTELEVKGSFNESTNLRERMWVYIEDCDFTKLENKPEGGCWYKLIRLIIKGSLFDLEEYDEIVGQIRSMEGMKWDYFSNIEVLKLSSLHWGHQALNLEGLMCLRILELSDVRKIDRVEGLEKLKHLTYFIWESFPKHPRSGVGAHIVGQLPSSLKQLKILDENVVLETNVLAQCHYLSKLELIWVKACSLDLSNCQSLESVYLFGIQSLQTFWGPNIRQLSKIQSLGIHLCIDFIDIPGIDHLIGLKELHVRHCPKFEVPNLLALVELQNLSISSVQRVLVVPTKDCFPHHLPKLDWCLSQSSEQLDLFGFTHLEVLDLSGNVELTSLSKLGDLPALQSLNLRNCRHLLQLPNLSASRNLKRLELSGCSVLELFEKDIQMLCELPLLQPVSFSDMGANDKFKLDFAQGKVLIQSSSWDYILGWFWEVDEWEQQYLNALPINIRRRGIRELNRLYTWEVDLVDLIAWDFN